jgi:hypothetical protein
MHNDPTKTTPLGMIRYSHEFMEAALAVDNKMGNEPGFELVAPIPAFYLIGHSIELSLKAFLLSQKITLVQTKKLSHDIKGSLRKAKEVGLLTYAEFTNQEVAAFELLHDLYSTKQFEYIVTGRKMFPVFGLVESFSAKLFNSVATVIGFDRRFDGYR